MKSIQNVVIITIAFAFLFVSCTEKHQIRRQMAKFISTEIQIPDSLECISDRQITILDRSTLKESVFIIYYDSLECSSCKISHMMDVDPLYEMADTSGFSVMTIFAPRPEDVDEVRLLLMTSAYDIPIYLDSEGFFKGLNEHIPVDERFHSFLLDNSGKPIFVGNPLYSSQLLELFRICVGKLKK